MEHCLCGIRCDGDDEALAKDVLSYVFDDHLYQLPSGDADFGTTLLRGLRCAVANKRRWAIETILKTLDVLNYRQDSSLAPQDSTSETYMQACADKDWASVASLILGQAHVESSIVVDSDYAECWLVGKEQRKEHERQLKQAIEENDIARTCELLLDCDIGDPEPTIKRAVELGQPQMIIAIIQRMEDDEMNPLEGLAVLLELGQTAIVSDLLRANSVWHRALEAASKHGMYGPLEAMIYQTPSCVPYYDSGYFLDILHERQVLLRVIAYQASATQDHDLYK